MDALLGIGVAMLAIAAAAGWSFWSRKRLMESVAALQAITRRLASGDLDARAEDAGGGEFHGLASDINKLAEVMRTQHAEQQRAHNELRAANEARLPKEYVEQVARSYTAFADDVAQGKLTARVRIENKQDALGQLGSRLNDMAERLHNVMRQVQQANADMVAATNEITASTDRQAAHAAQQSAAITETTATLEKVQASMAQTAQYADQLSAQHQKVWQQAQHGAALAAQTVNGMDVIRERVDSIAQTIATLNEQTATIGEITQTVTTLADQSNLLALNAAIEAARAGEQGRGFADATQRVRQFAERAKATTDQMQDVLRDITQAASTAATVAAQGTQGVAQGAGLAGQAGQVAAAIAREAETGAQAHAQVTTAAQQQTAGMEQIGQAMGVIQQASAETLTSTRQVEKAAKDLAGLTQSLQDAVGAYRL